MGYYTQMRSIYTLRRVLSTMSGLTVSNAGFEPVNGKYFIQPHTSVPESFDLVCQGKAGTLHKCGQN